MSSLEIPTRLSTTARPPAETFCVHEHIELPEVAPLVELHHLLAAVCPGSRVRKGAPRPTGAASTPLMAGLSSHRPSPAHATAVYLKPFQASSYECLQKPLFGLRMSQGGLTNML